MRIGIVSYWFNRGQGTVGRQLRSLFDGLGHQTFVLARPARESFSRPGFVDESDVWDQPGVTRGSTHFLPAEEYIRWARDTKIDAAFFDQNYQFEEIAQLRAMGVRTFGRFVWESFGERHVAGAMQALDVIYSLTQCEQSRYASMGIDSPHVPWGCHPEILQMIAHAIPAATQRANDPSPVTFLYPGGYLSPRKPTQIVIDAFRRCDRPAIRLVVKTQHPDRGPSLERELAGDDQRITIITDDLPTAAYYQLLDSADVCLAPSRWEGLGLHLYEATALAKPIITNDNPPMNEIVVHDHNGLLVRSTELGQSRSGIDTFEPDGEDLTRAIDRLADRDVLQRLTLGAARRRDELSWTKTTEAFAALLATESRHRADIDSRVREAKPDSATLPGAGIRR